MSLVNYVLIGLLGAILAVALHAAKWDISRSGNLGAPQSGQISQPF